MAETNRAPLPIRFAYTTGYLGHSPDELRAVAEELGAVVVDIRFRATSRLAPWREGPLRRVLGERYARCPNLGNVRYKDGPPIEIADLEAGIGEMEALAQRGSAVILLCACRDAGVCHRTDVATELKRRGYVTTELDWRIA